MASLFDFTWTVDQAGYVLETITPSPLPAYIDHPQFGRIPRPPSIFDDMRERRIIRPKGGAVKTYRPLEENPGLFKTFANMCVTDEGHLNFIEKFGFISGCGHEGEFDLSSPSCAIGIIHKIAHEINIGDNLAAAKTLNSYTLFGDKVKPLIVPSIRTDEKGLLAINLIPENLFAAMLLQAAEEIESNKKSRKCKNCGEVFLIGSGEGTSRKEFCGARCRVAWSRKRQEKARH